MEYKLKKSSLHMSVDNTMTDIINRLHQVEGDDRCSLLLEHIETLTTDWEDLEVSWLNFNEGVK
tara:strand:+ start:1035 stop:1226 length:192 start_codon:yes stop_codon:yes gene_type:complete